MITKIKNYKNFSIYVTFIYLKKFGNKKKMELKILRHNNK